MPKDYSDAAKRIAQADVVLGSWIDPSSPGDPFAAFIKGRHRLDRIIAEASGRDVRIEVIECDGAREADLLRQRFGDGLN